MEALAERACMWDSNFQLSEREPPVRQSKRLIEKIGHLTLPISISKLCNVLRLFPKIGRLQLKMSRENL